MRTKDKKARAAAAALSLCADALIAASQATLKLAHAFDFDKPVRGPRSKFNRAIDLVDAQTLAAEDATARACQRPKGKR